MEDIEPNYTNITALTDLTIIGKTLNGIEYEDIFENIVIIQWSNDAQAGTNNPLGNYIIEYQIIDTPETTSTEWLELENEISSDTTKIERDLQTLVDRGKYLRLRIKNIGSVAGYESVYTESNVIKRNSSPKPVSEINIINLPNNEYSYGEAIKIQWSVPEDVDNNVERYYLGIISNNSTLWQSLVIGTEYVFDTNNSAYSQIKNSEQFKFAIVPQDVFGLYPEDPATRMTFSSIITRYDISGVRIGKNGEWVDCQVYIGTNGEWIEQEVNLGLNNSWNETSTERL